MDASAEASLCIPPGCSNTKLTILYLRGLLIREGPQIANIS